MLIAQSHFISFLILVRPAFTSVINGTLSSDSSEQSLRVSSSEAIGLSSTSSTSSDDASGTHGSDVRDYVATGLGSSSASITTDSQSSSVTSPSSTLVSASPITRTVNATSAVGNGSVDGDACFVQWASYWSASASDYSTFISWLGGTTWFSSFVTSRTTFPAIYPTTSVTRNSGTDTSIEYAGGFPTATVFSIWTYAETYTYSTYSPASTLTDKFEQSSEFGPSISTTVTTNTDTNLITPACQLPSVVSQCQSQWASWESRIIADEFYFYSDVSTPLCPRASIGTSLCDGLKDYYISSAIGQIAENPYATPWVWGGAGSVMSYSTYPNGSVIGKSTFPTGSSLGPGCTLGCARCAITGGKVRLLYWPATQTSDAATTFGPVVTPFSGTTLTSPTVYISYSSLYASDSCSAVGANHSATIIPIPESTLLSSLYLTWLDMGHIALTSSFNYSDLNTPIPESIYTRQPICAWTGCPESAGGYKPIIVVPPSIIRSIDPAWSTCSLDIRGLYDPPYALHGAAEAAAPTPSDPWPTTTPASPASAPQQATPEPSSTLDPPPDLQSSSWSTEIVDPSILEPSSTADPSPSVDPSSNGEISPGNLPSSGGHPSSENDPNSGGQTLSGSDPLQQSDSNDPKSGDPGSTAPQSAGSSLEDAPPPSPGQSAGYTSADANVHATHPPSNSPQESSSAGRNPAGSIGAAIIAGFGGTGYHNDPAETGKAGNAGGLVPSILGGGSNGESSHIGDGSDSAGSNSGGGSGHFDSSSGNDASQIGTGSGYSQDPSNTEEGGSSSEHASLASHVTEGSFQADGWNSPASDSGVASSGAGSPSQQPTGKGSGSAKSQEPGKNGFVGNANRPLAVVGGQTIYADPGSPGGVVIASHTFGPGSATIIDYTPISVGAVGLAVGSSTIPLPKATVVGSPVAIFTVGGKIFTAQPGQPVIVDGETLSTDDPATTIDGQAVSLASNGVMVGSIKVPYETMPVMATSSAGFFATTAVVGNTTTSASFVGGATTGTSGNGIQHASASRAKERLVPSLTISEYSFGTVTASFLIYYWM